MFDEGEKKEKSELLRTKQRLIRQERNLLCSFAVSRDYSIQKNSRRFLSNQDDPPTIRPGQFSVDELCLFVIGRNNTSETFH